MYTPQGSPDKEQLISQYAPLVKRLAFHLMAKLPASVQVDDLIQNGMIGLLDALGRFEEGLGAQFETYAVQRIRGSMLDGLRENDWLPRGVRREMRRVEAAIQQLEHQLGRQPGEQELADALGIRLLDELPHRLSAGVDQLSNDDHLFRFLRLINSFGSSKPWALRWNIPISPFSVTLIADRNR